LDEINVDKGEGRENSRHCGAQNPSSGGWVAIEEVILSVEKICKIQGDATCDIGCRGVVSLSLGRVVYLCSLVEQWFISWVAELRTGELV
jgi:hypothetical protein